ncbi:helix-turn-helix transcriptional regulator [Silvanigrella aquatica]|uniref:Helix-turn-helix domain-containing protein n=1 Tax=Silvanigrella aquatica TaxID=1915309 RepID=A0A1L4D0N0_9BACT|nr:helix-turn-helix domain-containing protein [Silvanigrella aquatica]APJ03744.1 hypothetical protein AXG55_07420 [Silvanigrella aquatica]
MSDSINTYECSDKKMNFQEFINSEEVIESFTISAEEAAQILGVNRSRLSQLTSKGVFPFERRKIETRNRLFYKLSDLLNHQRSQIQGSYLSHQDKFENFKMDEKSKNFNNPDENKIIYQELSNHIIPEHKKVMAFRKEASRHKIFKSAKELQLKSNQSIEHKKQSENILLIKEKLVKQLEEITQFKRDSIKKENNFLIRFKENEYGIYNIQNKILSLQLEIKQIREICQQIYEKKQIGIEKSNESKTTKVNWKLKKAKFTPKLTTSR